MQAQRIQASIKNNESEYELLFSDIYRAKSQTIAFVTANFESLFSAFNGNQRTNWNTSLKYCYFRFWLPDSQTREDAAPNVPKRFNSVTTLVQFLTTIIPNDGITFDDHPLFLEAYEKIDGKNTFPNKIVCRNSLIASARGRKNWSSSMNGSDPGIANQTGISNKFNNGAALLYYLNYTNEVGRRFVEKYTGADPGVNDDGVIWWRRGQKNAWGWPVQGLAINTLSEFTLRTAAWDLFNNIFVHPAPGPYSYDLQTPFLWYEENKQRLLAVKDIISHSDTQETAIAGPAAIVFPMLSNGGPDIPNQYLSFMPIPLNVDCFFTDSFDSTKYEVIMRIVYKKNQYSINIPLTQQGYDHLRFDLVPSPGSTVNILFQDWYAQRKSLNNMHIPIGAEIALRNKNTGERTKWKPLLRVLTRTRYCRFQIVPWTKK